MACFTDDVKVSANYILDWKNYIQQQTTNFEVEHFFSFF